MPIFQILCEKCRHVCLILFFSLQDTSSSLELEPGDALSLVCPNPRPEVDAILARLGLADKRLSSVSVALDPTSAKKRAKVPDFVPEKCSLEELLTWHLDLRTPPKKVHFLKSLTIKEIEK